MTGDRTATATNLRALADDEETVEAAALDYAHQSPLAEWSRRETSHRSRHDVGLEKDFDIAGQGRQRAATLLPRPMRRLQREQLDPRMSNQTLKILYMPQYCQYLQIADSRSGITALGYRASGLCHRKPSNNAAVGYRPDGGCR